RWWCVRAPSWWSFSIRSTRRRIPWTNGTSSTIASTMRLRRRFRPISGRSGFPAPRPLLHKPAYDLWEALGRSRSVAVRVYAHPRRMLDLFLLRLCRWLFARWWNNVLHPHISDQVAVVFHVVHVVDGQRAEFGKLEIEELHQLSAGNVGHTVVGFVAVCDCIFQGGDKVGFGGFGLLDVQAGIGLAKRRGTKHILCVSYVSDDLAIAADRVSRLEVVI